MLRQFWPVFSADQAERYRKRIIEKRRFRSRGKSCAPLFYPDSWDFKFSRLESLPRNFSPRRSAPRKYITPSPLSLQRVQSRKLLHRAPASTQGTQLFLSLSFSLSLSLSSLWNSPPFRQTCSRLDRKRSTDGGGRSRGRAEGQNRPGETSFDGAAWKRRWCGVATVASLLSTSQSSPAIIPFSTAAS